jgi:hypothetical protein
MYTLAMTWRWGIRAVNFTGSLQPVQMASLPGSTGRSTARLTQTT